MKDFRIDEKIILKLICKIIGWEHMAWINLAADGTSLSLL